MSKRNQIRKRRRYRIRKYPGIWQMLQDCQPLPENVVVLTKEFWDKIMATTEIISTELHHDNLASGQKLGLGCTIK